MGSPLSTIILRLSLLSYVIIIIPALVNVAFLTLLERKILGYAQERKGPNKVAFIGLLQPFADAVKLFTKESVKPEWRNKRLYFVAPVMSLLLALWVWGLVPLLETGVVFRYSAIILLIIISFGVYPTLLAGWSSNRKYALIGALRGVAQTISYEVRLALFIFRFLILSGCLTIRGVVGINKDILLGVLLVPLGLLWFVRCLAETNRTPFDFAEGESELVSGFNIEYGRGGFALIFMAEYASILFLSLLTVSLLFCRNFQRLLMYLGMTGISGVWIWARATLPRYRYDMLINLAWKRFLPASLNFLLILVGVYLLVS